MKNNDYEPSRPVQKVIEALSFARPISPRHFEAPCPLDSDHTVSVVEGENGRASLECEDGDWLSDLLLALGLRLDDLFESPDDINIGSATPGYPLPRGTAG